MAYARVAGNAGANTPGVDGLTAAAIGEGTQVPGFLDGLRAQLKAGTFRPLPVGEAQDPQADSTKTSRQSHLGAVTRLSELATVFLPS